MNSKNPSASALHRAEKCPASFALPHVRSDSDDAKRGSAGHRFLELVPKVGRDNALEQVPEEFREMCEAIDLEGLPLTQHHRQEVAFAYDVDTGKARELGCGLGRDYGELAPSELAGTIDVVEPGVVYDYKFDGYDSHSPAPAENPQLLFAALCSGASRGTLIHIRPDGSHWSESADYDAFALDEFSERLKRIVAGVKSAQVSAAAGDSPDVARGSWCKFCPAAASCPAVISIVRAVAAEPSVVADEVRALITPETARAAYQRLESIKQAINEVSTALYMYASEHPIDLGDGQVYGPVKMPRDELDARTVRKVLAERFGHEVADEACDYETSKAGIERGLRGVVAKAKSTGEKITLKALKEEALSAIAKAGGLKQTMKEQVRVHRANGATVDV